MKKILLFVPLLLLLAVTTSTAQETVLTGHIHQPKGDKVSISSEDNKWEASLVDGKFELKLAFDKAGYFTFAHGNETSSLFLEPGDQVKLKLDPAQFDETIQLTGKGAEESNYLFSKYLMDEELWANYKDVYSLKTTAFLQKADEIHTAMKANLGKVSKASKLNAEFLSKEQQELAYNAANTKLQYPEYHKFFTKNDPEQLGEDYLDFTKGMNFNDESLIDDNNYNTLLSNYISFVFFQKLMANGQSADENPGKALLVKFDVLQQKITNKTIQENLMYKMLSSYISYEGVDGVETPLATFNKSNADQARKDKLNKLFAKASTLAKGQPAPSFSYPDIEGSNISLETFRGRYVYIDVWATWCAPCLKELPHLEELQKTYKGNRNIAFVSISIDQNKDAWRKMVTEKKMKGFQLIGDKAWASQICDDYMIQGIPRFILIDKEGKIINQNAPRPSSDELTDILADLMSE